MEKNRRWRNNKRCPSFAIHLPVNEFAVGVGTFFNTCVLTGCPGVVGPIPLPVLMDYEA